MTTKTPAKKTAPTKATAPQPKSKTSQEEDQNPSGSAGVPLPSDPSATRLQAEQDELQQPGQVAKAVADQVDNDPGYSKDQLAHMQEYWAHDE
jgi:hypothetical protein